jgi:hypothetical protein
MADLTLDPSLGMPFVHLVDDAKEVEREALAWLLHSPIPPAAPAAGDLPHRPWRRAHHSGSGQGRLAGGA